MKIATRKLVDKIVLTTALFCMTTQGTLAAYLDLAQIPLFIGGNVPPKVMLTISKDQQLFKKAYNDYTDLNIPPDGTLETTYTHGIDYYGYFDPYKCYVYVGNVFRPDSPVDSAQTRDPQKPANDPVNLAAKYCNAPPTTNQWSGNFLNWLSMSRMDTVRKLLYGGMRFVDTAGATVLERAYLPPDAHAWAKYYNKSDIAQLTPFNPPTTPTPFVATTTLVAFACLASQIPSSYPVLVNRQYQIPPILTPIGGPGPPITTGGVPGPPVATGLPPTAPCPNTAPGVHPAIPGVANGSNFLLPNPLPFSFTGVVTLTVGATPTGAQPSPGDVAVAPTWDIDVPFTANMATGANALSPGDQIRLESISAGVRPASILDCSGSPAACLIGTVQAFFNGVTTNSIVRMRVNIAGVVGAGADANWRVTNLSRTGISFCNVTTDAGGGIHSNSHTNRNPPLIRVARGNYELWNANEVFQCKWLEEKIGTQLGSGGTGSNGNQAAISRLNASADNPRQSVHGLGVGSATGEFHARVEACVVDRFGTERCKRYPNGNYKPIGLLQEYGDVNLIDFGLMTGSYSRNVAGGVLRKNVVSFNDEVNHDTDGTFKHNNTTPGESAAVLQGGTRTPASTANPKAGIVNTLNYMRIWGYNYATGQYTNATAIHNDNCSSQLTNIGADKCTSWGNPMAEIYFESLRYFAGGKNAGVPAPRPSIAYKIDATGTKDNQLGLPLPEWQDKLDPSNYCAPLNVVVFNASVSTNEEELRPTIATDINSSLNAADLTTAVGALENINGKSFFAGKILGGSATPPGSVDFELCTAKNIPGLGDVSGICPEGASVAGTFLISGLAHHARTNKIRADIPLPSSDKRSLKVTTYGIQLATNVPQLVIPVPGSTTGQKVVIQPIYRLEIPATGLPTGSPFRFDCPLGQKCYGSGALVDLKFIEPSKVVGPVATGKVLLHWEDSEQGGDYDQDMFGTLEWRLDAAAGTVTVTTHAVTATTVNPQGFGFSISGTKDRDGPHFFSGIAGKFGTEHLPFSFPGSPGLIGTFVNTGLPAPGPGCTSCRASDDPRAGQKGPVRVTFELGTTSAGTLNDPLWYAAKYGAFVDNNGDGKPDDFKPADAASPEVPSEWDNRLANGQQGSDGIPDTYFLVSNPLGLVAALDRAFVSILSNASASSVATNSTSLQTGTTIYQARFNANDWSGQVLAFTVSTGDTLTGEAAGTISQTPLWDAGQIVNFQDPLSTSPPAATTPNKTPSAIGGAGRTILTFNDHPDPVQRKGVPFRWPASLPPVPTAADLAALTPTDISARLVTALNTAPVPPVAPLTPPPPPVVDFRGKERLNYVRGSQASEGVGSAGFRARPTSRLGDIVNSNPNFVGAPNAGFGEASYAQFRQQNIDRKPMIYVGGNDGMLHGFRAEDGRELLAYVPSMVHDKLNRLMSKTYAGTASKEHRYFVDGSPEISDAFITVGTSGEWRTVLVSGLGAGGQGVFALNITKPQEFAETKASEIVMWEFSDKDDRDMGYVLAQPTIRRMAAKDANGNNRWAAIVPAGYNNSEPQLGEISCTPTFVSGCTTSTTGSAYLFIIFLDGPGPDGVWNSGTDYIKIRARITTPVADDPASPNGLTQPLAADVTADGIVDYIYAGDLRGNLWKFDVTSTTATDWRRAENRVILYTAKDTASPPQPQPITAKPEATLHPDGTGFIITFGTGKYLEPTDPFNPPGGPPKVPYQVQSFYGIWDRNDSVPIAVAAGDGSSNPLQTVVPSHLPSRSLLLGHEIKSDTTGGFRVVVPLSPANIENPNWFKKFSPPDPLASDPVNAEHMGWYLDFPNAGVTGERSVFRPILTSGRLIFTTLLPLTDACEFGGTSFIMVIDPTTGGRINAAVLDVTDSTKLNSDDKVSYLGGTVDVFASGAKSAIGITPTPTIIKTDSVPAGTTVDGSKILGTSGPLVAASGVLLAYALAAGSSGGNASTMIGLSAAGGRVSWREITADGL
jgi:type IV pilus assembly protein PilY1